jgi:DNA (cytosine-5)-methyltransferase 1
MPPRKGAGKKMTTAISNKLEAASIRGYFRTIDLFAGCGGMTLGFDRAGFRSVACVEINDLARKSHELNFASRSPDGYRAFADIRATSPETAVNHLLDLADSPRDVIDIVIGGPPCQAFSRLGRAALWRLAGVDYAHADDQRASYYLDFLHYVAALQPLAFVMENVREIGKFVGRNVAEEIAVTASEMGYETRYALLNAVWFGVPQLRERMFIIGIHKDLHSVPSFPRIRHNYLLPVGYSTSRSGKGHLEVLSPHDHYIDHADRAARTKSAVSARDAFADLPPIFSHLDGRTGKGFRRDIEKAISYVGHGTPYSQEMRKWPGFESGSTFKGHVIRYTPRDYETFGRMPHGGMYPAALDTARQIFD